MSITEELLANNKAYAESFTRTNLPLPPAKQTAIVTCMDTRVEPCAMLGLKEGDAHVIRNAGGVVTDDVIRSLIISQRMLGTTAIVLIHHTDCGMMTFENEDISRQIADETGFRPPFALCAFDNLERDVSESLARVRASPYLLHRDQARGFVFAVETGLLKEVV